MRARFAPYLTYNRMTTEEVQRHTFYHVTIPFFVTTLTLILVVLVLTGGDGFIFRMCSNERDKERQAALAVRYKAHGE